MEGSHQPCDICLTQGASVIRTPGFVSGRTGLTSVIGDTFWYFLSMIGFLKITQCCYLDYGKVTQP